MQPPEPILVADLFKPTLDALLQLLKVLTPEDWVQPTVCAGWSVREVVLHLLAVEISNISRKRDGHSVKPKKPNRNGLSIRLCSTLRRHSSSH